MTLHCAHDTDHEIPAELIGHLKLMHINYYPSKILFARLPFFNLASGNGGKETECL